MLRSNKLLDPARVRELMAAMQPKEPDPNRKMNIKEVRAKAESACEMIIKTNCSIPAAARSWGVSSKTIIKVAREKGFKITIDQSEIDAKAKEILDSGASTKDLPNGLRQRVAYELALRIGMSEACRKMGICRRGLYYYCERYSLPTPERSERRVR